MIDQFTAAGLLQKSPEERTLKNGSRFMTALLVCSPQPATYRLRLNAGSVRPELVEVSFFDKTCMEYLRNCRPGIFLSARGYIRSVPYKRQDGSYTYITTLVGTDLTKLEESQND